MNLQNKILQNFRDFSDNIAIQYQDSNIQYAEMAENALKIAHFLTQKGLRDQCIGIEIKSPVLHLYAILGILLSRNYYLSITSENGYFIAQQDQLPIGAIIGESVMGQKGIPTETHFDIEQILATTTSIPHLEGPTSFEGSGKCSVFSTSGSTGAPKLVIHSLEHIYRDSNRQIADNAITEKDKIDLLFAFTFSASLACIFPALLSGATICIYSIKNNGIKGVSDFWVDKGVTFSTLSVSSFRAVCRLHPTLKHIESLRFFSIGAEPVTEEDIELFRSSFAGHTVLQVAYATTEVRTISEYRFENCNTETPGHISSVGKPVAGKEVHILSEQGDRLPPQAVGEIVVSTKFIARTCANGEHQSQDKQLFHTGDLGYFDTAGYLYYTGRKQFEVKINGIKINLYSIEKEVEKMEEILRAAALVKTTGAGRKTIVLYFQSDQPINIPDLKAQLASILPISHLPNHFYQIENFPQTHTGKVDRRALESLTMPEVSDALATAPKAESNESLENTIIRTWNEVLGIHHTESGSDFFNDLGGDSLSAMVCIGALEKQLGTKIPNYLMFSCRTPHYLAKYIDYNLAEQHVSLTRVNTFIKARKSIYFLDLFTNNSFRHFTDTDLANHYNLSYLHFDIYNHAYRDNIAPEILKRLQQMISEEEEVILMGYCFAGYMAFQLAALAPNVSLVVMLDPPNYFEYDPYTNESRWAAAKTFLYRTFKERDFSYPWYLLNRTLQQKQKTAKHAPSGNGQAANTIMEDNYTTAINYMLEHLHAKSIDTDCLFVKSTRSYLRNIDHGYNWRKYVGGRFDLFHVHSNHEDLINMPQPKKIIRRFNKFV